MGSRNLKGLHLPRAARSGVAVTLTAVRHLQETFHG
jgi:hypothetical protein